MLYVKCLTPGLFGNPFNSFKWHVTLSPHVYVYVCKRIIFCAFRHVNDVIDLCKPISFSKTPARVDKFVNVGHHTFTSDQLLCGRHISTLIDIWDFSIPLIETYSRNHKNWNFTILTTKCEQYIPHISL